jgi:hypothetical protein
VPFSKIVLQNSEQRQENGAEIIKTLYKVGVQLRLNKHLHEGYKNLIERIVEFKPAEFKPSSSFTTSSEFRIVVANSAIARFERLSDRIELLMLGSIIQSMNEKDALLTMVCKPLPPL